MNKYYIIQNNTEFEVSEKDWLIAAKNYMYKDKPCDLKREEIRLRIDWINEQLKQAGKIIEWRNNHNNKCAFCQALGYVCRGMDITETDCDLFEYSETDRLPDVIDHL